uniref:Uncharacterized protein n=1 Tax=Daphnia galeata TaxID=27404 RepID=A0A8J2RJQ7_9CRUS|nr:unnamed protein product [Daphnia galeata]
MNPIASALDILQGEKKCFTGIGMVLPLLTRVKKQLRERFFANLGPMRDTVIQKIDERFEKVFEDECYLIAATTHPFFKCKWMSGEAAKSTKTKLKQLVFESITPVEERDRQSLTDDFLQDEDNLSEKRKISR